MKFFFMGFIFSFSMLTHASLNIKPGLWDVDMTMKSEGKTMNPQIQMQSMMNKLSPEQRAKMASMMEGRGMSDQGLQVCYTEKMLIDDSAFNQNKKAQCQSKIINKTAKQISMKFTCADGTTG